MSFWRAILYFLDEALSGLARAWKSSLLAVLTIAVSLFVLGAFLIVGRNTSEALETWRSQAHRLSRAGNRRVTADGAPPGDRERKLGDGGAIGLRR